MATSYMHHRDDFKKMVLVRRKRQKRTIRNIVAGKELLPINCYGTADLYKYF